MTVPPNQTIVGARAAMEQRLHPLAPCVLLLLTVGLLLGGLLVGVEPVGGDPDRMYRPIKSELARSLSENRLPFWSDRFGLGLPLVAESHVAAFYPPNWLLYRALDVAVAYRLSMWLHYVALAAAMYAYARRLGLLSWGAALAALTFTLCGFQAIHSSHEPLYSALPFMPLALYFAEDYIDRGRSRSLAALALAWGVQLTLGHFQIQTLTAGLVIVTGLWRSVQAGSSRRTLGLAAALGVGAGIAAVQLVLSWDLANFVGSTNRPVQELMFFSYPPAHWAELAVPRLFAALPGGPEHAYWFTQGTTGYEACLYVGTIPLVLACVGLTARHDRALAPWRALAIASFALATMPHWWPAAYRSILSVPGLGTFRAPARYTLITSLGLSLLAGRGFDRALTARQFALGLYLAGALATAAFVWAIGWSQLPAYRTALAGSSVLPFLGLAAIAWVTALAAVVGWRLRIVSPAVPFLVAAAELGLLYYHGTTVWAWAIRMPDASPVMRRLASEANVGTVAGAVSDLPVRVNRSPAYPYIGMRLPMPMRALELSTSRAAADEPRAARLLARLGVTHGIWDGPLATSRGEVLYQGDDAALDRLALRPLGAPHHATWSLVRYAAERTLARVALQSREAPDPQSLLARIAASDSTDIAWFLPGDRPLASPGPLARSAHIVRWDAYGGEVDHDGSCDIVITRTYLPGWTARIDDALEVPVVPVDGGLQSVHLSGSGRTRVALRYRSPRLVAALAVSAASLTAVVILLGVTIGPIRNKSDVEAMRR